MNCVDCNSETDSLEIELFGKCLSCHIDDLSKPCRDLEFIKGYTACDRCMSPLKKLEDGSWSGDFSLLDIMDAKNKSLALSFMNFLRSVED